MCLLEEIKYVKFFNLQVQVSCVTPLGRPQGDEKNDRPQGDEKNDRPQGDKKNETFPGSKGFIQQEELDIPILLDCICERAVQSFISWKLSFTSSNFAAMKPRVSGLFIYVTHFTNSKCKKLTFFSLQANIGGENKRFEIDFRVAPNQFDSSIPKYIFAPIFVLSSSFEQLFMLNIGTKFQFARVFGY